MSFPWCTVPSGGKLNRIYKLKLLNVQVPFYFKSIVDSLNIPLSELTAEQTVWALGGTAIVGCTEMTCDSAC